MAQQGNQADRVKFCCSICLDLLKDPVTIPCGHNYCMNCIKTHWDGEDQKIHSCPQCRKTFIPRPELGKNTMLAELVDTSAKLQENSCSLHNEVMKIFCRTDQQCICILCTMDEHKGHDIISAAAERTEKQKELRVSQQNIQQRIQDREKDVKKLQEEMEAVNQSADKAVEDSEKTFTELIRLLQKRSSDVKQQIRSKQETEVNLVRNLQEKLEKEITELKRKDTELEKLSCTEDHTQFLKKYPSMSGVGGSAGSPRTNIDHLWYFKDVMVDVTAARDKLQAILSEKWPQADLKTRAEFLQCSRQITLDPNTPNSFLVLSDGNRKITYKTDNKPYPQHPDRFVQKSQVLSKDGLTGCCYWEVERSGYVDVAVAYKSIARSGDFNAYAFGYNDKSWALRCDTAYTFRHNNISAAISGPQSSRIGVYLDHSAGVLSFYSISDTMTLIHRVQTTFTEPLYAGLYLYGNTAEFCELK